MLKLKKLNFVAIKDVYFEKVLISNEISSGGKNWSRNSLIK